MIKWRSGRSFPPYFPSLRSLFLLTFFSLLFPSSIFLPLPPFIVKTEPFALFLTSFAFSTFLPLPSEVFLSFLQQLNYFSLPFIHFTLIFLHLLYFLVGFWSWKCLGLVCWIFREDSRLGNGCFLRKNKETYRYRESCRERYPIDMNFRAVILIMLHIEAK